MLCTTTNQIAKAQAQEGLLPGHGNRPSMSASLIHLRTFSLNGPSHILGSVVVIMKLLRNLVAKDTESYRSFYLWFNDNNLFLDLGSD